MLTKYRARLDVLLAEAIATTQPPMALPVIPQCWPVYHDLTVRIKLFWITRPHPFS